MTILVISNCCFIPPFISFSFFSSFNSPILCNLLPAIYRVCYFLTYCHCVFYVYWCIACVSLLVLYGFNNLIELKVLQEYSLSHFIQSLGYTSFEFMLYLLSLDLHMYLFVIYFSVANLFLFSCCLLATHVFG